MRNTKRWSRHAAAGCLCLAAAAPLRAQAAAAESGGGGAGPAAPELHYENGRVLEPYLPYSRPFVITGSPVTSKGRADVVWGRIFEARDTTRAVTTNCWVRPEGAAADTRFRTLYDPLWLGREYQVRLNFAQKIPAAYVTAGVLRGLRRATNAAEEARDPEAINSAVVSEQIARGVRDEVALRMGTRPLYLQITREGDCGTTDVLNVLLSPEDELKLKRAVAARLDERAAMDRLGTHVRTLQLIDGRSVVALVSALRAARANRANARAIAYTLDDVQALDAAVQGATAAGLDQAAHARLGAVLRSNAATPRELVPHTATLHAVLAALGQVRAAEAAAEAVAAQAEKMNAESESVAPQVQGQFIPISEASVVETSWGAEAEVRKLQIGTAVTGASVMFGPGGATRDAIMVTALRFYLAPVDRSLPIPWSSPRARAAIDIGALFQSEVRFRGQKQNDLFNGISPTLGVSYDLTRYLSVSGGMLFFRQPSTNPLADTTGGEVRTAVYLGVGTDFDALNQLNTLLKTR